MGAKLRGMGWDEMDMLCCPHIQSVQMSSIHLSYSVPPPPKKKSNMVPYSVFGGFESQNGNMCFGGNECGKVRLGNGFSFVRFWGGMEEEGFGGGGGGLVMQRWGEAGSFGCGFHRGGG